tara:strand:- start:79 stop:1623 length:1545 start_codon:yes stop_codon:yes gene_type:complete
MFFQGKSKDDGEPVVPTKGIKRTPSKGKHPEPEPEPESEAPKKPKKAKKPIPKPPPFPEKYRVVNIIDDQALDEVAKERKNGYQECDKAELHTRVVKRDGLIDLILSKYDNLRKYSRDVALKLDDASFRIQRLKSEKEARDNKIIIQDKMILKMKTEHELKKNDTVDMDMVEPKCEVYYNLFIRLYDKLTVTKKRLDLYQTYLKRINSVIQLSVITLSIASSFMQALDSKTYEILFKPDTSYEMIANSTLQSIPSYGGDIEGSTYSSTVSIVTLSISTYSALVIAAERHFSFQQRETNVEKLKESYTEPINRIRSNLEMIRPWRYKSYYMKKSTELHNQRNYDYSRMYKNTEALNRTMEEKPPNSTEQSDLRESTESRDVDIEIGDGSHLEFDEERKKDWISTLGKLDREYSHIVDVKKELDTSLEKMVGVKTMKSYQSSAPRKERRDDLRNIHIMEQYANNTNFIRKLCWCRLCRLCCCRRREVNHTYDEDDMNHIEDKYETDKLNDRHLGNE